jgi:hypothetical protein
LGLPVVPLVNSTTIEWSKDRLERERAILTSSSHVTRRAPCLAIATALMLELGGCADLRHLVGAVDPSP